MLSVTNYLTKKMGTFISEYYGEIHSGRFREQEARIQVISKVKTLFTVLMLIMAGSLFLVTNTQAAITNVKLNGNLVSGGAVIEFEMSPDGSTVVYEASQDTLDVSELYSVPIGGGTPTKLNGSLVTGGNAFVGKISPDGSTVVYRAFQDTDHVFELYSVPIGGGVTPIKLNGSLPIGGDVVEYEINPDGSMVVYKADQDTDGVFELYSVPIGGGTPTKLSGSMVIGGNVIYSEISSDGSMVVYKADQDTFDVIELYSVPIGGGTPTKLNGSLPIGGDVSLQFDKISPDGRKVVYKADQDADNVFELYASFENTPPVANDDAYNVDEDSVLNIAAPGVLGDDTDADGDPITAVWVSGPANGMLTLNSDGSFTYTPNPNFIGPDTFDYKANDNCDDSNDATVTITVDEVSSQDEAGNIDDQITELFNDGILGKGQANSLSKKLDRVIKFLNKGKTKNACKKLKAFVNHVQGLIRGGVLSAEQGQALIDDANNLRAELGC